MDDRNYNAMRIFFIGILVCVVFGITIGVGILKLGTHKFPELVA